MGPGNALGAVRHQGPATGPAGGADWYVRKPSRPRSNGLLTVRATANPVLRFDRVSKAFQGQIVLNDLTLEMQQGEFLTLLGPSGCGKTTSLNLVAGLIKPDAGTIFLRGEPVDALPPRRRGLGLVFQSWALFPHMNVFDNIGFGLKVRSAHSAEIRKRVGEMLDLVRLPGVAAKFP